MRNDTIVIKVGTSTLTTRADNGVHQLNNVAFHQLGQQIAALHGRFDNVVIVSSGAITAGMQQHGMTERPTGVGALRALASVGNVPLINAWQAALDRPVGSLLLTRHSLDKNLPERNMAVDTIDELCKLRDIPIINENDAIADEEIRFGDNDTLAAVLASKLAHAGHTVRLVILSDVNGLYRDKDHPDTLIPVVTNISQFEHLASGPGTSNGTGGMATKLTAAKIAHRSGIDTWIVNGSTPGSIQAALDGVAGTHFTAHT